MSFEGFCEWRGLQRGGCTHIVSCFVLLSHHLKHCRTRTRHGVVDIDSQLAIVVVIPASHSGAFRVEIYEVLFNPETERYMIGSVIARLEWVEAGMPTLASVCSFRVHCSRLFEWSCSRVRESGLEWNWTLTGINKTTLVGTPSDARAIRSTSTAHARRSA